MKAANKLFSVFADAGGGLDFVASSSANTATSPLAVTVPTGTASGDRLIYFAHSRNANFAVAGPEGGGWVQLCAYDVDSSEEVVAWTRLAGPGESGTLDLAFTSVGTTGVCGAIVAVRGAGAVLANIAEGNTPADSIGEAGALVFGYFGSAFAVGQSYTAAPSGMDILETENSGANDTKMFLCSKTADTTGQLQTGAPTTTVSQYNFAVHLVCYPAASVSSIWVVASDTHIGFATNRTETLVRLGALRDRVNISPASLLVMNGDTLDEGTDATPAQDILDAAAIFADITAPKRFVLGNHDNGPGDSVTDVTPTDADAFYDAMGDTTLTQDERDRGYYSWEQNGVTHLILNAVAVQAPSEGDYGYGATQKTWVENFLDNLPAGFRLVVYSHVDPTTTTPDYFRLVQADRIWIQGELEYCAKKDSTGRILACLTAHEHGDNHAGLMRVTRTQGIDYLNKVDGHRQGGEANIKNNTETDGALDWHSMRWDEAAGKLIVVGWGWSGSTVLTPATVPSNSLLTGLVAFYKMEDAASATTADAHGTNDLTKTGTVTSVAGYHRTAASKAAGAYYVGGRGITENATQLSVAGWLTVAPRANSPQKNTVLLSQYHSTGNQRGFAIEISVLSIAPDHLRVYLSPDGINVTKDYRGTVSLDNGVRRHIGFTFDGGTLVLYVDGVAITTTKTTDAATPQIHAPTSGLQIGCVNEGGAFTDAGVYEDVGLWSRVLTAGEFAVLAAGMPYEGFE